MFVERLFADKNMKILFVVTHMSSGGAERTVSYLSSYLAENGHDVEIVKISKDEPFYPINSRVKLISLNISNSNENRIGNTYLAVKRFVSVNRQIAKEKPDVVFCMMAEIAKYILMAHKKKGFILITSERSNPIYNHSTLKDRVFSQSDGIVFQTQRAMDYYPDNIRKKGCVIHNAVGNDYVYSVGTICDRKRKIVAIGRTVPEKDYCTLLHAFSIVLQSHPDYVLEIYGKEVQPEKATLDIICEKLCVSDKVVFKGEQKAAIIQAADAACYVLSSKSEGMPNALMEAMAVGLPCVSADCPNGPAELIDNEKNGLLVPVGDYNAMARAIIRMIDEPEFAKKCGDNRYTKKREEYMNLQIDK